MTAETLPATCPECGTALPAPGARCPRCVSTPAAWRSSRTAFLSLCGLLLIPLFTVTGVIVRLFHEKQAHLAQEWRAAGDARLAESRSSAAIEDFRSALLYAPESALLQLELAKALAEQGQTAEAQDYLLNLRGEDPEDSPVNLELARIAAQQKAVEKATAYYHDAMYGHWPQNAHEQRFAARSELIEFLLKTGRNGSARAEAVSMAVENPADPEARIRAANYLLQAGDAQTALAEFRRAAQLEPGNASAYSGAGNAALAEGDFVGAERYFARAIQRGVKDPDIAGRRETAALAAELDPFVSNLTDTDRRRRVLRIFHAAEGRAKACLPAMFSGGPTPVPDNLKTLAAQRNALPHDLTLPDLLLHPDLESKALNWALQTEKAAAQQCGTGGITDEAIALIATTHRES